MKKIYNLFKRTREEQICPECGSDKVSIAVDTVMGYWRALCEVCETMGPERDLIDMDNEKGSFKNG